MKHKYIEMLKKEKNYRLNILRDGAELWLNAMDLASFHIKKEYKDDFASKKEKWS